MYYSLRAGLRFLPSSNSIESPSNTEAHQITHPSPSYLVPRTQLPLFPDNCYANHRSKNSVEAQLGHDAETKLSARLKIVSRAVQTKGLSPTPAPLADPWHPPPHFCTHSMGPGILNLFTLSSPYGRPRPSLGLGAQGSSAGQGGWEGGPPLCGDTTVPASHHGTHLCKIGNPGRIE